MSTQTIQVVNPEAVTPLAQLNVSEHHDSTLEEAYRILYIALKERKENNMPLDGKYYVWSDGHSKPVSRGRPPNKTLVIEYQRKN